MRDHTPGPWNVGGANIMIMAGEGPDRRAVAFAATDANATLVAAAPDLLAALEAMVHMHEHDQSGSGAIVTLARAAIAKARGQ